MIEGRVYLSAPIHDCDDYECFSWRLEATALFGADRVLDPSRRDYRGRELSFEEQRELVELDLVDIRDCAGLLCFPWKPSPGTSQELVYAKLWRKPVAVVIPYGGWLSPWIRYHASYVTDFGIAAGVEWLKKRLRWT